MQFLLKVILLGAIASTWATNANAVDNHQNNEAASTTQASTGASVTDPASATAVALITDFQSSLSMLAQDQHSDLRSRYQQLAPVVDRTHDLSFISRLIIGPGWRQLDEAQREAFVTHFRELAVTSYAARFAQLQQNQFTILGVDPQPRDRRRVRAQLSRPNGEALQFDYILHRSDDGWRIVNILVDGVSDLALKRAEYTKILRDNNFETLLSTLSEQTAALSH